MVQEFEKISKEVADYINGYPAFKCGNGVIDGRFFSEWFSENGYDKVLYDTQRVDMKYLEFTGLTKDEFEHSVKPAINTCWNIRGDYRPVTMQMAEMMLMYIEPAWCKFKGIDSTGYLSNTGLYTASELLDDDMLDI
jgi:hypothetical protein